MLGFPGRLKDENLAVGGSDKGSVRCRRAEEMRRCLGMQSVLMLVLAT